MTNPIKNPPVITGTLKDLAQSAQVHIYNIGTLSRSLIGKVHTFAQETLGRQLGTNETKIIVAVVLVTAIYGLYKIITMIKNYCGKQQINDDNNNNNTNNPDEQGKNESGYTISNIDPDVLKELQYPDIDLTKGNQEFLNRLAEFEESQKPKEGESNPKNENNNSNNKKNEVENSDKQDKPGNTTSQVDPDFFKEFQEGSSGYSSDFDWTQGYQEFLNKLTEFQESQKPKEMEYNPFKNITEEAFIEGEEGYIPYAHLTNTNIDPEALGKWAESEELKKQCNKIIHYLNLNIKKLNNLENKDFQNLKKVIDNTVLPLYFKIKSIKELQPFANKLINCVESLKSLNLPQSAKDEAQNLKKDCRRFNDKDKGEFYLITLDQHKSFQEILNKHCKRKFELYNFIQKNHTEDTNFEISTKMEKAHESNLLALIQSTSKLEKLTAYKIDHQLKFSHLTKEILDKTFDFTDLLNISDEEFKKYKLFLNPFRREIGRNEIQKNPSYDTQFNKHINSANALFVKSCQECEEIAHDLHEELKKVFPSETAFYDDANGTVTCSADMLLFAFGLAKKNPLFQRLASIAFNYEGGEIHQQAQYAQLIQKILCGSTELSNKHLHKTGSYGFKVKEIQDQTIYPQEDSEMTKNNKSYAFTQLNTSSAKTMEQKFKMMIDQYVKDFCGKRSTYEVTFNGTMHYPDSSLHPTIKNNEMLKREYTDYLKNLSKESLQNLIQEAKDSSLIIQARSTFTPTEEDLQTSDFPVTILRKMFKNHLDNEQVKDTLYASSFDEKDLNEIVKSSGLKRKEIEPLLRYKVLELLCFRSQSVIAPISSYPKNLNKNNLLPINSRSEDSCRTLDLEDDSFNSATFTVGTEFYEIDDNGNSINYAKTQIKQYINGLNKNSKVSYQIINDLRVSPDINQDAMTLLISQADPSYLETICLREVKNLKVLDNVKGGGTVVLDDKGLLQAKDGESYLTRITRGSFEGYIQPELSTLTRIKDSFQHLLTTYRIWDETLSVEDKINKIKTHVILFQDIINKAIEKIPGMVTDQSIKGVSKQLRLIQENYNALNELLNQWKTLTSPIIEFCTQIDKKKVNSPFFKNPVDINKMNNGKQFDTYESASEFKKALIKQVFASDDKESENNISTKIRDAFKEKAGEEIEAWGKKNADAIHNKLFLVEEGEFAGSALNTLTEDQRKHFIEVFYDELKSKVASMLGVS